MTTRLVLLGGGGCAREVLDVIDAQIASGRSWDVLGVLDDGEPDQSLLRPFGVSHLGKIEQLTSFDDAVVFVIGIGLPTARSAVAKRGGARDSPVIVHPTAALGRRNVELAAGVVICSHVSVQSHVLVGRHVHINQNVTVGHDVRIGNHSVISPLVAISGNVHIGRRVLVGAGASIIPGVRIGDDAVIGAGAAVIRDVPAGTTVVGVPARPLTPR